MIVPPGTRYFLSKDNSAIDFCILVSKIPQGKLMLIALLAPNPISLRDQTTWTPDNSFQLIIRICFMSIYIDTICNIFLTVYSNSLKNI